MNMRHRRGGDGPIAGRLPALIFLAGCFGIGLIMGCVLASYLGQGVDVRLSAYLDGYFSVVEQEGAAASSLLSTFWEVFRWPLAAGVFGLTAFGVVAIPVIFCVRGFLLSYAVAVFVQLWGGAGLLLALSIFGLSAILSVTALFVVGLDTFEWGRTLTSAVRHEGRERAPLKRRLLLHAGAAACWLTAGALLQHWLSPVLLKAAVSLVL